MVEDSRFHVVVELECILQVVEVGPNAADQRHEPEFERGVGVSLFRIWRHRSGPARTELTSSVHAVDHPEGQMLVRLRPMIFDFVEKCAEIGDLHIHSSLGPSRTDALHRAVFGSAGNSPVASVSSSAHPTDARDIRDVISQWRGSKHQRFAVVGEDPRAWAHEDVLVEVMLLCPPFHHFSTPADPDRVWAGFSQESEASRPYLGQLIGLLQFFAGSRRDVAIELRNMRRLVLKSRFFEDGPAHIYLNVRDPQRLQLSIPRSGGVVVPQPGPDVTHVITDGAVAGGVVEECGDGVSYVSRHWYDHAQLYLWNPPGSAFRIDRNVEKHLLQLHARTREKVAYVHTWYGRRRKAVCSLASLMAQTSPTKEASAAGSSELQHTNSPPPTPPPAPRTLTDPRASLSTLDTTPHGSPRRPTRFRSSLSPDSQLPVEVFEQGSVPCSRAQSPQAQPISMSPRTAGRGPSEENLSGREPLMDPQHSSDLRIDEKDTAQRTASEGRIDEKDTAQPAASEGRIEEKDTAQRTASEGRVDDEKGPVQRTVSESRIDGEKGTAQRTASEGGEGASKVPVDVAPVERQPSDRVGSEPKSEVRPDPAEPPHHGVLRAASGGGNSGAAEDRDAPAGTPPHDAAQSCEKRSGSAASGGSGNAPMEVEDASDDGRSGRELSISSEQQSSPDSPPDIWDGARSGSRSPPRIWHSPPSPTASLSPPPIWSDGGSAPRQRSRTPQRVHRGGLWQPSPSRRSAGRHRTPPRRAADPPSGVGRRRTDAHSPVRQRRLEALQQPRLSPARQRRVDTQSPFRRRAGSHRRRDTLSPARQRRRRVERSRSRDRLWRTSPASRWRRWMADNESVMRSISGNTRRRRRSRSRSSESHRSQVISRNRPWHSQRSRDVCSHCGELLGRLRGAVHQVVCIQGDTDSVGMRATDSLRLTSCRPGSAASRAGLSVGVGGRIRLINGSRVRHFSELQRIVLNLNEFCVTIQMC